MGLSNPDFVAIGHVTLDHFGEVTRPGGSALYAAVTAHRLGLRAAILTSHGDNFPLEDIPPQIEVVTVPAATTTRFAHEFEGDHRRMRAWDAAAPLSVSDLPEDWRDAPIALLAPVLGEVDPALAAAFSGAAVGAAAQGWLRSLGAGCLVQPRAWESPEWSLAQLQALFVSRHDIAGQEPAMHEWLQRLPVAIVTAGRDGALLYVNGDRYGVAPLAAREIDPTGAGDVFAATFLVHYHRSGDPWEAAEAAACAASLSVQATAWNAVPDAATLAAALVRYRAA